ncbi:MAG: hypothetical protein KDJ16_13400 [Hyphomicrobiales bacterium]|nr:hypothetical protein [Hyphomicrobiales bacterium]
MTKTGLDDAIASMVRCGCITADDVLALRRLVYDDGGISRAEAEQIFAADEVISDKAPEWGDFFVEAMTDFVVHQETPRGHVSEANAEWLTAMISRDGYVKTSSELEVLLKVIEVAENSPESLEMFALYQVKGAVLESEGVLARGGRLKRGVIGSDEVDMLRRILYAYGGHEGVAISRAEADLLFDLNDHTIEAENCSEWSDLFVKAIANHLMAAHAWRVPSREDALAREAWLDSDEGFDWTSLFGREVITDALVDGLRRVKSALCCNKAEMEAAYAERNEAFDMERTAAEKITDEEAEWLSSRIGRDRVLHDNERALLAFISEESPDIHPSLKPLIEDAA